MFSLELELPEHPVGVPIYYDFDVDAI